jgi:hypothetical protein
MDYGMTEDAIIEYVKKISAQPDNSVASGSGESSPT